MAGTGNTATALTPPFRIVVKIDGYYRRLCVVHSLQSETEAQYKIIAKNKTLLFTTNQPIVERRGLQNFPWTWRMLQGDMQNRSTFEVITKTLEAHLRGKIAPWDGVYKRW